MLPNSFDTHKIQFFYSNSIFKSQFFCQIFVRTLGKTHWKINFNKYLVVYQHCILFQFKMASNECFLNSIHDYYMNYQYFYPPKFVNYENNSQYQVDNSAYFQYYQQFSYQNFENQYKLYEDPLSAKIDETNEDDQTQSPIKTSQSQTKTKRTQAPRFRPTKNNESNISNQAFSFVTNQNKSKSILQTFYKNKKKVQNFYDLSKQLTSKRKKYMSKNTLMKLCKLSQYSKQFEPLAKINFSNSLLSLKEFESGVRFLIIHFLKNKSMLSILTSQKIATNLKKDHIVKARQIVEYIEQNILLSQSQSVESNDSKQNSKSMKDDLSISQSYSQKMQQDGSLIIVKNQY